MNTDAVALQLYTVRDETARDFAGTLRRVAALGYKAVEFAGYGGLSAAQQRDLLAETGLTAASTHVGLDILAHTPDDAIAYCKAIDCRYLVLPGLPNERRNPEALRALAPRLDDLGRRCQEQGITFGYHNHDWEFAGHADGTALLDLLLDATDPALVALELDAYWVSYAGADPVAYLQRRTGRVPLVHLKDMTPERTFAEVGDGTLDMGAIIAAARAAGARWYIVENDAPTIPSLDSARRSLTNLQAMAGGLIGAHEHVAKRRQ